MDFNESDVVYRVNFPVLSVLDDVYFINCELQPFLLRSPLHILDKYQAI